MSALANSRGGSLILSGALNESAVGRLAEQIDPPLGDLISICANGDGANPALAVHVRQSPYCPHIDVESGSIYEHDGAEGIVKVATRAGLDRLYRKGQAAEERAQRAIDGAIERMQLASFGHYGIAIVACLRQPSAEPYLWAAAHPDELATETDAFISEWRLTPAMVSTRAGDVELRGDRDVTGVVRITRGGCVAAGESRRKPQGDVLGTADELQGRLAVLLATVYRIFGNGAGNVIIPRLLCEGLKGTRLSAGTSIGTSSAAATTDVLMEQGSAGDAGSTAYQQQLLDEFAMKLLTQYRLQGDA
jgi:hypothetical protein